MGAPWLVLGCRRAEHAGGHHQRRLHGAAAPVVACHRCGGTVWFVELSNPSQTARAGFTATSAKPGDIVIVLGNRDKDASKNHMKAVRVTIGGQTYDLYPERIRTK